MPTRKPASERNRGGKLPHLEPHREHPEGAMLTTDQGVPIAQTDDSLKAGPRGPTLLEDFHLREKITRFDHERIPERVVHARGSAAHGFFQVYESLERYTKARFLCDPAAKTPVFVRFSTVAGSRGSADTVRDVRGFATKFYTSEGNFDLVGNNMPVFFIQDGMKFPDVIHAVKPEPHNEMPQAGSAHDTFWDFVSLQSETAHMVMWAMSDRGLPRSYRMMEGFGVHTFRLLNAEGEYHLCKFHWKPVLGVHSLVWDEAQKIAGKDPDFHRRDLWEAIESGSFPEWELGLQILSESDQLKYGFDLLDPTKLVPEELVPVQRVGKLTLDRNPDNFFAETEQVAFHVGHLVPGIDVTNDPLMQARLFSYLDTQLTRLGGPNFAELPINRPVVPVHNHQQDGFGRHTIPTSKAMYHPNTIGGGCPFLAGGGQGYVHAPQPVEGATIRRRSETFSDHFSQARMFLDSQTAAERRHLVSACQFELGKVERVAIRERVIALFEHIDPAFALEVALALGVVPSPEGSEVARKAVDHRPRQPPSPALSIEAAPKSSIATRKVAMLIAPGVDAEHIRVIGEALAKAGAEAEAVGPTLAPVRTSSGELIAPKRSLLTTASVLYDAVIVPGGAEAADRLRRTPDFLHFIHEAYKHCKPIAGLGEGVDVLANAWLLGVQLAEPDSAGVTADRGVMTSRGAAGRLAADFVAGMKRHRYFEREEEDSAEPLAPPG